ncbi:MULTISPECIES: TetR/AcrR family transcriptional regulator [Cryobacterium]|uniref:TetR family transcriptional regulator n=1 Tax=Cryobacterium breve TaxID=1259258 RepID=A0ABY2J723_9MICO|nr:MULTISPECIES: TetR/AcrR family transcriptional regulator [Cryobacterium]TFC96252.1 TetR family transcriptional regulator [Cryobacterium sp. TmT3-12]TFD00743.1 TetR family transcriptional regulator [Cryobacterium breve]
MPKVVDHDQRRVELVEATWRIIARHGIEGATMRDIAAEAGFANGALKPYFPTKDDLLAFAFSHVFSQTGRRMTDATIGRSGLGALRAYCLEILPLDDIRVSEARIVIPFWQRALTDSTKAELHSSAMLLWRDTMCDHLREADTAGELRTTLPHEDLAGLLMNLVLGAQITAVLSPIENSPDRLVAQLDACIRLMAAGD